MKHIWKRMAGLVCTVVLVLAMAGCGESEDAFVLITDDMVAECKTGAESFVQSLGTYDRESMEELTVSREAFARVVAEEWLDNMDEFGALTGTGAVTSTVNDDDNQVIVEVEAFFEKKDGVVSVYFDYNETDDYMDPAYITVSEEETLAGNLSGAAVNTVAGVGTVFMVLVFLVLLISLFKYVGRIGQKSEAPKQVRKPAAAPAKAAAPKAPAAPKAAAQETANLMDDAELVAVIAAAIAAAEQTPADGFVVRSIRKVNGSKWRKA